MKIGFDGRFIREGQSGNGMFCQQFLEGLAQLDDENEYTVYLLENNRFIQNNNFRLKLMPALHANSHLRFLVTFPLELWRNPVDIFHAVYTVPLRTSARVVLSLIEFGWITNPEDFPASWLFKSQLRLATHHSIYRADRIITPTWIGRDQLVEHFDIPEDVVEVIPLGLNESFLTPCDDKEIDFVKHKYALTGDYLLSVGDLHPRKNLGRVVKAFDRLKQSRNIPHQLVVVGKRLQNSEGIYRKTYSCCSEASIIFTGYVPLDELRALYQGATLFVFPSLDEGFGLPVHEAMASHVPVIVSNRGALQEIAGDAALVVDPLSVDEIGHA
ncbi:MAG: glycosyltransferase family 4 protein, partial [Desulfobacteraceae bacterium]|nr:glycosyltransferase family 4 protein [Desulfobacteraceae bacterium]